ncbi:hypothetical protein K439DRAFT_1648436 [Ramaria rubella]|nr:hypothetical protein K439DRAFT_1648436 [Ramaria rubella]
MPKNNPSGRNGPSNDVLKSTLLQYSKEGLLLRDQLRRLGDEHGLYIKERKLKQLNQKFNIPSVRKGPKDEHAAQLILNEVAADTNRLNGAGHIKTALATQGHLIPWTQLTSIGVFDNVCCDGHDKGNAQALQLGPWSGAILHMVVVPNYHLANTIGHVYLDFIESYQELTMDNKSAIPLWITVDKGTETGETFAMQTSLQRNYAPNISEDVHNTTIEGIWHWLRKTLECNFFDEVRRGHNEGIFNPNNTLHVSLFNWIWPPICQSVLDDFSMHWNNHRVHNIFTSPQAYGGEHCSIPIPQDAINALHAELLLSRQSVFQFVDEEFANHAGQVWHQLGSPPCSVSSGWEIFTKMLSIWPEFETNKSM